MINPARTVGFCYFIIASVVLPFAACISIIQEEYNIIASRPLKLVCNIESTITNAVTIRTPDNSEAVSCTPTVVFPPNPASCSSPGSVYTGSINETANTVTVTANTLPGDVNGTWTCTHGSNFEPFDFPNPIPCFTTESLVLNPSSFPGNITKDSTAFSLSVIYSCINVDVTFKWILKAGTSHEYPSPSVTKDSSSCTDTATCTGVNAYTQIISSDAVFQFAKAQGLQGGYELTVEAHFSDGITALKSQSIVYFEFSVHTSTLTSITKPPPDKTCFLGFPDIEEIPCGIILAVIIIVILTTVVVFVYFKLLRRNICKKKKQHSDEYKNHDITNDGAAQAESTAKNTHEDSAIRRDDNPSVSKPDNEESKDSATDQRVKQSRKSTDDVSQHENVLNDDTNIGAKKGKKEEGTERKDDNASIDTPNYRESQSSANGKRVNKSPESTSMDSLKQNESLSNNAKNIGVEDNKNVLKSEDIETKF